MARRDDSQRLRPKASTDDPERDALRIVTEQRDSMTPVRKGDYHHHRPQMADTMKRRERRMVRG